MEPAASAEKSLSLTAVLTEAMAVMEDTSSLPPPNGLRPSWTSDTNGITKPHQDDQVRDQIAMAEQVRILSLSYQSAR